MVDDKDKYKEGYKEEEANNVKGVIGFLLLALVVSAIVSIFYKESDSTPTHPKSPTAADYKNWEQEYWDSDGGRVDPRIEVHQQYGGR